MNIAIKVLSGKVSQGPPIPNHTQYDEDMGYRTMTREDAAIIQQGSTVISPQTPTSQNAPQSPSQQGHHRTSRYVSRMKISDNLNLIIFTMIPVLHSLHKCR
jgi:hypothetical protein